MDSNHRPHAYQACALTSWAIGPKYLFYWMFWTLKTKRIVNQFLILRKEVIQPHLPIRLPCYDFTPVISPAFGSSLSWDTDFGHYQLPWCDGRCVQDPGTYSPQYADLRLLAIPTSCTRVAECNPDYDRFCEIGSASRLGYPLYRPLYDVWSPGHKGHEDLTSSPPSSGLSPAVSLECPT